jgi:hypothetical protein
MPGHRVYWVSECSTLAYDLLPCVSGPGLGLSWQRPRTGLLHLRLYFINPQEEISFALINIVKKNNTHHLLLLLLPGRSAKRSPSLPWGQEGSSEPAVLPAWPPACTSWRWEEEVCTLQGCLGFAPPGFDYLEPPLCTCSPA